jgi:hypothetical protein
MTASVPVLLITGPVGSGKSTVAAEATWLLREANLSHALVDLPWIGQCWPVPADGPWNERLTHRRTAPAAAVAAEMLRLVGWLGSRAGA